MVDDGRMEQRRFILLRGVSRYNMSQINTRGNLPEALEEQQRTNMAIRSKLLAPLCELFDSQLQPTLMPSPAGCSVRLPRVRFVREKISAGRSFNKHRPSCLHVAICEAGVQGSFDIVSHIQTERGLHLFFRRQRSVPLGPGAYLTQVRQRRHICTQPNGQR